MLSQERGMWQGRAEAAGGGMVQSTTPSHLFIYSESITPTHHQALFFSDWDMQGHQKLEIDH